MAQTQLVITTCCLIGAAFGASLFGIDVAAPPIIGEMLQAHKPHMPRRTQSPLGWNNPFSGGDQNTFNSASSGSDEKIKFPQEQTNQRMQDSNQISETHTSFKKNPYNSDKVQNLNQNTAISGLTSDSSATLGWSYTTEAWEFETTTDDTLNRIAAPPAVVASLLG